MDPSGLALLYIRTWEELFRSDYPRGILAPPYACADAGNFAFSTSRLADLIVNSDLIKTSLKIKNVNVSVNTSYTSMFMSTHHARINTLFCNASSYALCHSFPFPKRIIMHCGTPFRFLSPLIYGYLVITPTRRL